MSHPAEHDPQPTAPPGEAGTQPRRVISSEAILQGQREVIISHAGEEYRLSLTRNGKLCLNKCRRCGEFHLASPLLDGRIVDRSLEC